MDKKEFLVSKYAEHILKFGMSRKQSEELDDLMNLLYGKNPTISSLDAWKKIDSINNANNCHVKKENCPECGQELFSRNMENRNYHNLATSSATQEQNLMETDHFSSCSPLENVQTSKNEVLDEIDYNELLTNATRYGVINGLEVCKIMKMSMEQNVDIDLIIEKTVAQLSKKKLKIMVDRTERLEFAQMSKYGSLFFTALNFNKFNQCLDTEMNNEIGNIDLIDQLNPAMDFINEYFQFNAGEPFMNEIIELDKLPTPRKKEPAQTFLNRLVKGILQIACTNPEDIQQYAFHAKNSEKEKMRYKKLPEQVVTTIQNICAAYFGLRTDVVQDRFMPLNVMRGKSSFILLGDSDTERLHNLDLMRMVQPDFINYVNSKIQYNLHELRRREVAKTGDTFKWTTRAEKRNAKNE